MTRSLLRLLPAASMCSLALLLGPAAVPAAAQDDDASVAAQADSNEEAEQLLRRTSDLLSEAGVFAADIEFLVLSDQDFAKGMFPPANGRYVAAANDEGEWKARITGKAQPFGGQEMVDMDMVWDAGTVTTLEPTLNKVIEGPAEAIKGSLFSTIRHLQPIDGLDKAQAPFSTLFEGGTVFTFGDPVTIDGRECQVVRTAVRRGAKTETRSIAIDPTDHLPRRVLLHTAGFDRGTAIGGQFTNVRTDRSAAAGVTWELATPEGFEHEVVKAQQARRAQPRDAERSTDGAAKVTRSVTKQSPAVTPSYPLSPKWQFQTADGEIVSRDSLNGKTAVLYFWGTWCIPCRAAAPLNKQLWADYKDQKHFEMIGLAVRERDPDATYEYIAENGYEWTQLVGADKPSQLFEVPAYPTWYVIGPAGEVLYQSGRPEGGDFEPTFAEMRKMIDKGLEMSK